MTMIDPFSITYIYPSGLHLTWYFLLDTDVPPLGMSVIASKSWAVRLGTVAVAAHFCLLGRGRQTDTDRSQLGKEPQITS